MPGPSPDLFRMAFDDAGTPQAIVDLTAGAEGVGVAANHAWRELFGVEGEPTRLPLAALIPHGAARGLLWRLAARRGRTAGGAVEDVTDIGDGRLHRLTITPLHDYHLITVGDVVGHSALRELGESEKWLQAIVDNTSNQMFIKDRAGRYLFFNRSWEEYFQHLTDDPIGLTDAQIYPPDVAARVRANDLRVLELGTMCEFEERAPTTTGNRTFLSRKFPLADESGNFYAVVGISTDITARKQAEVALQRAQAETERANAAKSEFLSRMSHELRTPLNSILGYAQLLRSEAEDASAQLALDRILGAGQHLLSLINEVLDLTRIEAGQYDVVLTPVDACTPLREALGLIGPLARQRGIELSSDMHAGLFSAVLADRQRLVQVLLNLLSNAVKYNRAGGTVHVSFERRGDTALRYVVRDEGPGVDECSVERMFTPFERLGAERTEAEGTGLGLAVAKALVEAMGGTIGVAHAPPVAAGGAVFYVELALTRAEDAVQKMLFPESDDDGGISRVLPHATVLYIEDNEFNVDVVKRLLAGQGDVTFVSAASGHAGLALAQRHPPDLVLLDLHLPDIPGEEVLRRLKARTSTASIPVVVLSADATPRQASRLKAEGATEYLTKPLDLARLLEVMATTLADAA